MAIGEAHAMQMVRGAHGTLLAILGDLGWYSQETLFSNHLHVDIDVITIFGIKIPPKVRHTKNHSLQVVRRDSYLISLSYCCYY